MYFNGTEIQTSLSSPSSVKNFFENRSTEGNEDNEDFQNQRLRPLFPSLPSVKILFFCSTETDYRRKRSQGRACIPTRRKFKLRFPPPEFFTEGNEGNEGWSGPAKYSLCFLRYLLFKILSDAKGRRKQRYLTLDSGPQSDPRYGLCSLRYLL